VNGLPFWWNKAEARPRLWKRRAQRVVVGLVGQSMGLGWCVGEGLDSATWGQGLSGACAGKLLLGMVLGVLGRVASILFVVFVKLGFDV